MPNGPQFIRFFWPILSVLRELGGAGARLNVIDLVLDKADVSDEERAQRTGGGRIRVRNQVGWARQYLAWGGLIDGAKRGWWELTEKGWSFPLEAQNDASAFEFFKRVHAQFRGETPGAGVIEPGALEEEHEGEDEDALPASVLTAVLALSPDGFERLCNRLLTELGLVQLKVVGGPSDKGIDVEGLLKVNPVVSFHVGVQCKRYEGTVGPRIVREFQGALGAYDRGILMTTGTFTKEAKQQATAPGPTPVDLIDGEELSTLMIGHQLGIKQVVDEEFFKPFK